MREHAEPSPAGWYVETYNARTKAQVNYGPFPTQDAARRARFFSWDRETFNAYQRKCLNLLFACGEYTEGEMDYYVADPGAGGYKSFKVKPAKALKRAAYWNDLDRPASDYPEGNLDGHASFGDFFFNDLFVANFKREPVL